MNKKLLIAAVPCFVVVGACQQRDADEYPAGSFDDRAAANTNDAWGAGGLGEGELERPMQNTTDRRLPGLGEGEQEVSGQPDATDPNSPAIGNVDIPAESSAVGLTDQQVIDRFRADIAGDPDLSAAAQNVQLQLRNNELTLTGTVASEDLGEALQDYAEELADGRDVENELKVRGEEEGLFE